MIRAIDAAEFSCLESLIQKQQLFHYNLDPEYNKWFLDIGVQEFTEYMTETDDYICYVAFDTGKPVGFIACTITVPNKVPEAFIEDVFVDESVRGNDIGRNLMNVLFKSLVTMRVRSVSVHVTRNNESVFSYYKKFGFVLEETDDTGYIFTNKNVTVPDIQYNNTREFDCDELVRLFTSVDWVEHSAAHPERLQTAMMKSDAIYSAWHGNNLVGLISAIDDSMHVFIVYLLVDPVYQNLGIGKELLSKMLQHYNNHKVILTTCNELQSYYEKQGFELDSIGLMKFGLDSE